MTRHSSNQEKDHNDLCSCTITSISLVTFFATLLSIVSITEPFSKCNSEKYVCTKEMHDGLCLIHINGTNSGCISDSCIGLKTYTCFIRRGEESTCKIHNGICPRELNDVGKLWSLILIFAISLILILHGIEVIKAAL
jgi:hypothetical protein